MSPSNCGVQSAGTFSMWLGIGLAAECATHWPRYAEVGSHAVLSLSCSATSCSSRFSQVLNNCPDRAMFCAVPLPRNHESEQTLAAQTFTCRPKVATQLLLSPGDYSRSFSPC